MAKELDEWISKLEECKQLEETQVKVLCEKVHSNGGLHLRRLKRGDCIYSYLACLCGLSKTFRVLHVTDIFHLFPRQDVL